MTSRTLNIDRDRLGEILDLLDAHVADGYIAEIEYDYDAEPSRAPDLRGHPDTWEDGDSGYRHYQGVQGDPAREIVATLRAALDDDGFLAAVDQWLDAECECDLDDASDDNLREDR